MPVLNSITEISKDMTEWRRHLHSIPELCFKEYKTSSPSRKSGENYKLYESRYDLHLQKNEVFQNLMKNFIIKGFWGKLITHANCKIIFRNRFQIFS